MIRPIQVVGSVARLTVHNRVLAPSSSTGDYCCGTMAFIGTIVFSGLLLAHGIWALKPPDYVAPTAAMTSPLFGASGRGWGFAPMPLSTSGAGLKVARRF